ncbi:MAG: DUF3761 domain-containing protein [Mycolicibacterium cosmeticum]|nr:DUF3761 domain-containing protein [Mycolicibacterium cosmeticum]
MRGPLNQPRSTFRGERYRQLARVLSASALLICCISAIYVAPPAAACPAGSYEAASGDCVESPDSSTSGVTAICGDGSDSHSQSRSGTCSHHGGVSQWCPCSAAQQSALSPSIAVPTASPSQLIATGGNDEYVALAISPVTAQVGWGTAGSQGRADEIAVSECAAASNSLCKVAAEMHNGCAAIVIGSGMFFGGYGVTTAEAVLSASSNLPNGRVAGVQCSKG